MKSDKLLSLLLVAACCGAASAACSAGPVPCECCYCLSIGTFCDGLPEKEFSSRGLGEIEPLSFQYADHLTSLDLSANFPTLTLNSESFVGLTNLTTLVLNRNGFTSLPDGVFVPTGNLRELDLSTNQFSSLSPESFRGLVNLTTLYLESNPLTSITSEWLEELPSLTNVTFRTNSWDCSNENITVLYRLIQLGVVTDGNLVVCSNGTSVMDLDIEIGQSPVFSEEVYQAQVPETFVEGGYLRPEDGFIHVGCSDPVTGLGRSVTYSIVETDPRPFSLDPSTGSLSVTADLDYETNPSYTFHVRCSDIDFPSLTDTTQVVIIIESVNEYHPTVSPQSKQLFIFEDQAVGTVIASSSPDERGLVTYTVTDMDSGPHGMESVRYTLAETEGNSENAQDFSLDFTTGALVLSESLDVDNIPNGFDTINLRLTICDVQPALLYCPNFLVTLLVFSANDNFPQFSANTYEVSVPETTPVNSTLELQLLCTDGDRGAGEFEGIELENSNLSSIWDVNVTHGTITLREQLDFEVSDRHEFVVRCFDAGGREDFASVVIIESINEYHPEVSPQSKQLFILEDQAVGTVIASSSPDERGLVTYTVTDMDSGPHGIESVRYTLSETEGNSENAQDFSLDFTTGALVLSESLDVDNIPGAFDTINLRLTICDVEPPLQDCPNFLVVLFVFAANDNFPQFSANTYTVSVPETTPVNSILDLQLLCTDGDQGAGELEGIELENSNLSSIWDVNITHGTITLREQLDFEVSDRHEFVVRCFDTGGREDFASVVINVVPVNDIPPQFITGDVSQCSEVLSRFSVDRIDTADGYVVGQVQAVDNDTETGNELSYSIEGDSHFDINSATGEITLTNFIFAIEGSSFTLTVTVSDGDFNSTATVEVKVTGLLSIPEIAIIVSVALVILAFSVTVIVGVCCCIARAIKKQKVKINTEEAVEMTPCQAYSRAPQVQQRLAYNRAPPAQQDRTPEMDPDYETIPYPPASEQLAMREPTISDHHELETIPWQAQMFMPQDVGTPSGHDYEYVP